MKRTPLKICDSAFAHTFTSSWDNKSKYIEWVRDFDKNADNDLIFFTDQNIFNFYNYRSKIKIGWLIEPVSVNPYSYSFVRENYQKEGFFDYILTYDKELIELNKNINSDIFQFFSHGGSWIEEEDFKIYDKNKMVSIIASGKNQTKGHRLRHSSIEYYKQKLDVMGHGYRSIESKKEGLCDYRYSVIIENIKQNDYFTEKLIDCLSTGTVSIYWGTENIGNYFDERGIIKFDNISELGYILDNIVSEKDYLSRMDAIKHNLEECKKYRIAEDYIFENFLVKNNLI